MRYLRGVPSSLINSSSVPSVVRRATERHGVGGCGEPSHLGLRSSKWSAAVCGADTDGRIKAEHCNYTFLNFQNRLPSVLSKREAFLMSVTDCISYGTVLAVNKSNGKTFSTATMTLETGLSHTRAKRESTNNELYTVAEERGATRARSARFDASIRRDRTRASVSEWFQLSVQ